MGNNFLLNIVNLSVSIKGFTILNKLNLTIGNNEVHVIMGPNGSGKSTLTKVLVNDKRFCVDSGEVIYKGMDLLQLSTEMCSLNGIFLAFQQPVSISGVLNIHFLKKIYDAHLKFKNIEQSDTFDFINVVKKYMFELQIPEEFLYRDVNSEFSGGEKKKNEILQMLLLQPDLLILDEIDSGLDVDSLKIISQKINFLHKKGKSIMLITHYQRILNYLKPDYVHVLSNGIITKTGDYKLAVEIEKFGYI